MLNATKRGGAGQASEGGGNRKGGCNRREVLALSALRFDVFAQHDNCKSNASIIVERMKKAKKERIKLNIGYV